MKLTWKFWQRKPKPEKAPENGIKKGPPPKKRASHLTSVPF